MRFALPVGGHGFARVVDLQADDGAAEIGPAGVDLHNGAAVRGDPAAGGGGVCVYCTSMGDAAQDGEGYDQKCEAGEHG